MPTSVLEHTCSAFPHDSKTASSLPVYITVPNGRAHLAWQSQTDSQFKVRIRLMPLCRRLTLGGRANRRWQNCLCTQLDRHTTNQRNEACDIDSTTGLELPKTHPAPYAWLRLARMALVLQTTLSVDLTPDPYAKQTHLRCELWVWLCQAMAHLPPQQLPGLPNLPHQPSRHQLGRQPAYWYMDNHRQGDHSYSQQPGLTNRLKQTQKQQSVCDKCDFD